MMRRKCGEWRNRLQLREVRMENRSLYVVNTATVHVKQRSIHKADEHGGNRISGGDSSHGGTIPLDRTAANFLPA